MSITSLSAETQRPQHFSSCDERAIGRRVQRFASHDARGIVVALENLLVDLDEDRPECSCLHVQLDRVEADLAARRKAQRAGYDRSEEIAALTASRDALRAAIEATR